MNDDEEEVKELLQALDNEGNDTIMGLTSQKIKADKNDILQKLQFKREGLKKIHKKLKNYRYCNTVEDLRYGFYIRWIPLKDPEDIYLTNSSWEWIERRASSSTGRTTTGRSTRWSCSPPLLS